MESSTPIPAGPDDLAVLIQAAWDAFNRRDADALPDFIHDELEFRGALGQLAPEVFRGAEGMRRWWDNLWTTYEAARGIPEQVIAIGDHALSVIRFEARGTASGVELGRPLFQVAELRGSRISWLYHTFDAAEALRTLADRVER